MQVVLAMFRAGGERRSFSVVRDMTVIGRREDCDLRIPLGEVSRKHCRIIRDGDTVRLEDLGSSNGTYHNNNRVQEAVLGPGDSIRVGPVTFVIQIDGVPSDDEIQAPAGTQSGGDEVAEFEPVEDANAPSGKMADAAPPAAAPKKPKAKPKTAKPADDAEAEFVLGSDDEPSPIRPDEVVESEIDDTPGARERKT